MDTANTNTDKIQQSIREGSKLANIDTYCKKRGGNIKKTVSLRFLIPKSLEIFFCPCSIIILTKADPSNYQPTISKSFEKQVNHHLMRFLNKLKLIHRSQSGFRQKHSCQTALVKLIDHWMKCIDQGDIIGILFVDFRKVFIVVDHGILMKKLCLYKYSPKAIQWFES